MAIRIKEARERYQPDSNYTFNHHRDYSINRRRLAAGVGLAALGLPIGLFIGTRFGTCFYESISHFYYAQFWGGIFIAVLAFIATFLIAYRGENKSESWLATAAGICALGVAIFPTKGRGCDMAAFSGRALADFTRDIDANYVTIVIEKSEGAYFELFAGAAVLHFVSAAFLFAFLAYYCFRVFTRVIPGEHLSEGAGLKPAKRTRNRIYYVSGAVIVAAMTIMLANYVINFSAWNDVKATFVLETAALWAFGASWMVKGRFFGLGLLDDRDRKNAS